MKRYSLASFLLFAAVVALSLALLLTRRQLVDAQTQLKKLRNDARLLDPSEPDKMRAIEIPAFGKHQWRWRIDLPDNEAFVLRWAFDDIPIQGMPDKADGSFVPPKLPTDEFLLSIAAHEENGQWVLGVKSESISGQHNFDFTADINAKDVAWLAKRGGKSIDQLAGQRETLAQSPDSPFVLLRYRQALMPSSGVVMQDPQPTNGIIVWIERAENVTAPK